jgi:hypothetical protein
MTLLVSEEKSYRITGQKEMLVLDGDWKTKAKTRAVEKIKINSITEPSM